MLPEGILPVFGVVGINFVIGTCKREEQHRMEKDMTEHPGAVRLVHIIRCTIVLLSSYSHFFHLLIYTRDSYRSRFLSIV